ncbi:MAG TPA: hypothetical protein VNZ45_14765 [Bacteroidia bacterium]|jgi:hypothetical protein|nr:hypothetical protein [Bacteroidia bacterium]
MSFLSITVLAVGAWCIINGILHDIFVLRSEHSKQYNRDLLRLLMDGHILITCGAILMVSYLGIQENAHWAFYMAGISSISLLIYCAMIWPFLKSVMTIVLNAALLAMLVVDYLK